MRVGGYINNCIYGDGENVLLIPQSSPYALLPKGNECFCRQGTKPLPTPLRIYPTSFQINITFKCIYLILYMKQLAVNLGSLACRENYMLRVLIDWPSKKSMTDQPVNLELNLIGI